MIQKPDKGIILLSFLRQDSRKRLTEISKKIGVPVSTLHEKLKSFGKTYIKKFTCILDYESLGYSVRVNMLIKVKKEDKQSLSDYLYKRGNINSISKVNNGYDFIVDGIFKTINEFEQFSEKLDELFQIKSKEVFYIVDDIKREGFMSDPDLDII